MLLILIFFILAFILILIYHIKDNKKIHENFDINNKNFSIPNINLDDYGDIYLNIDQNTKNNSSNNNDSNNNDSNNNDSNNNDSNNNDSNNNDSNINNLKKNNKLQNIVYNSKDSIYGIYAWTNNPDFYIPSKDGIH
jgi:hypothetical protein